MSRLADLETEVSAINVKLADKVHQSPAQLSVLRKRKAKLNAVIQKIKEHKKSKPNSNECITPPEQFNQNHTRKQRFYSQPPKAQQIGLW